MDVAKNFVKATMNAGYDDSATTIVVASGHGTKFPTVPFNAVWYNSTDYSDPTDDPNVEIIRVTNIATDTLTVTRAQESTTAKTHNTGGKTYKLIAGLTAKVINTDIPALIPSKASGAEITAGTDDAKFATAKAIKDAGLVLDTDGTLAADSDSKIATQKATKTYADTKSPLAGSSSIVTTGKITTGSIKHRVTSETSSATPTINTDNCDTHIITALATAITSFTTNLSGTPDSEQRLTIRIKDNGTARAITWGSKFDARGKGLPTTTVAGKYLRVGLIWNSTESVWDCVAVASEA